MTAATTDTLTPTMPTTEQDLDLLHTRLIPSSSDFIAIYYTRTPNDQGFLTVVLFKEGEKFVTNVTSGKEAMQIFYHPYPYRKWVHHEN
jgi:hypothetical protein